MRRILAGVGVVAAAVLAGSWLRPVTAQEKANSPAFYTEKVRPILQTNCGKCHFDINHKGGLSLMTRESTLKGGRDGVVIVPGDPANRATALTPTPARTRRIHAPPSVL